MPQRLTSLYDTRVSEGLLRPDPAQRAVMERLEAVRESLDTPQPKGFLSRFRKAEPTAKQGLYLWGGVGRGKSMLMDMFFQHAGIAGKRRVHFHAFMQEVQAALHEVRKTGVDDAIKPVAEDIARDLKLLCFDEMQITDIADAMIVGRLFERLFAAGVVIITTSNRPPKDLYKDGLNRALFLPFIDLLEERMEVDELDAMTDYRQDRLAGEQVWFSPTDANAKRAIDLIWRDLTGGRDEPMTLEVKGRNVVIPRFWAGQARASFAQLCGTALGPADYLALVGAANVLVLEDIPKMGPANANEAKRFVTLVDTLYEGHVRLIASAEAEPEALYVEGAGAFEFERTASRLREMRGADWGSA
ncbi:AFG1 family ATPase [Rhodobacteraceae bacterium N5(2021)]|uniref:AFG1 family ATPase n=1 Tax=Gymnodinialimonas phycosphaerae TaxID=2841589 RepID=A0A975YEZ7_9RHOB|nr:cell division protein ZapE [Gymnodinialimonas phycosphaerae]MBY4894142.1 AFG1 family ATPase [Gymnodinialimonas phycosphaerae]